jgi:hypothetical protein
VNRNKTGTEQDQNKNGTGTGQELNRNGTGTEQEQDRNGTGTNQIGVFCSIYQKPWINNLMNIKKHYLIYLLPQLGFGAHNFFYLFGTIFGFNSSCQNKVFFFLNENRN